MKCKSIIKIIAVVFLGAFYACDDYLSLEPQDGVTGDKYWKNKEEVQAAVMGCYADMMIKNTMQLFFDWGELRADLIKPNPRSTAYIGDTQIQNGDISITSYITSWANFYATINNCNTVLYYAKETQKIDQSFSEDLLSQYEAEATCIRALMYFYLVRTFKDVPYITTPSLDDTQDYRVPQTKGEDIINYLIEDLKRVDRAENGTFRGIPFSYPVADENKGRFTVWSLKALLADLYLWKEDYENCVKQCNQIINSGNFALVPVQSTAVQVEDVMGEVHTVYYPSEGDANNLFTSMYVNGNSVESIFELQFSTDWENPFWNSFNPSSGFYMVNTETVSSTNLFIPSALDRGWYDIRGEGIDYRQGLVWKWIGLSRTSYTYRANGESFSNWIFYRLADVMLMKAEALNQLGKINSNSAQLEESLSIVRTIRSRACAPETTDLIPEGTTEIDPNILEDFILTERAREFAHEGKRWFDVLRNAKRNNYEGIRYMEQLALYAANPDKVMSLQSKWLYDYNSHYLPINENELRNNTALKQNPFYAQ